MHSLFLFVEIFEFATLRIKNSTAKVSHKTDELSVNNIIPEPILLLIHFRMCLTPECVYSHTEMTAKFEME